MKLPPALRLPERVGWRDHVVGAALALLYTAWLLAGVRLVGVPRDEGVYFRAAGDYWRWWRMLLERPHDALQQSSIDGAFAGMGHNSEHPPLMKTLFGASEWLLHDRFHVFADATTAFRLPAMCVAGMALWIVYLFGARAWSRRAGLVAAALYACMPQVFFYAHLACFDVPIAAMWILCVYVHWRAQEKRNLRWAIGAGVAYGLTLATKHNAWLLPFALVPHAFFVHRHAVWRGLRAWRLAIPLNVVAMVTVGPAVLVALWPYLWAETLPRLQGWVEFHTHHEYYNIEFLGRNYFGPPSPASYVPIMVLASVPTVTLVLSGVGLVERGAVALRRLRAWVRARLRRPVDDAPPRDPLETDVLLALSFLAAVFMFFRPTTPIFGGTKHWLPAYPVIALFAGRGFDQIVAAMGRALPSLDDAKKLGAQVALAACVVVAPLAETHHAHPFGISAYVPLVGGTQGGATLGLNRQFWGYTTENAALEYLNDHAPRGATVFIHDTTGEAWAHMQEEGRVRRDLRAAGAPGEAMFALVQHELHMNEVDYTIWVADGTDAPVYIVQHDGVPFVSVYRKP